MPQSQYVQKRLNPQTVPGTVLAKIRDPASLRPFIARAYILVYPAIV